MQYSIFTSLSASQGVSGSSGIPQLSTPSMGLGANTAINLLLYSFIDPFNLAVVIGVCKIVGSAGFTDCAGAAAAAMGVATFIDFLGCDSI
jgi:hypothetical protein